MDQIIFKDMSFYGFHGCRNEERTLGQPFNVDLTLYMDLARACETDDLRYTADDEAIFACVRDIVENERYNLIETVAGRIADQMLADFPAEAVNVTVHKPSAPIPGIFRDFAVSIERKRCHEG